VRGAPAAGPVQVETPGVGPEPLGQVAVDHQPPARLPEREAVEGVVEAEEQAPVRWPDGLDDLPADREVAVAADRVDPEIAVELGVGDAGVLPSVPVPAAAGRPHRPEAAVVLAGDQGAGGL